MFRCNRGILFILGLTTAMGTSLGSSIGSNDLVYATYNQQFQVWEGMTGRGPNNIPEQFPPDHELGDKEAGRTVTENFTGNPGRPLFITEFGAVRAYKQPKAGEVDPTVQARSIINEFGYQDTACASCPAIQSNSRMDYTLRITSLVGISDIVGVELGAVLAKGHLKADASPGATAEADMSWHTNNPFSVGGGVKVKAVGTNGTEGSPGSPSSSEKDVGPHVLPFLWFANTDYTVDIYATTTAYGKQGNGTWVSSATATVDPVFEIAPQYKNLWQIELSPNLAIPDQTPEPASIVLVGLPLLAGIALARRGRGRATVQ